MKIKKMMTMLEDVKPYSKGTATMWTDPYISKQLLDMHINPDTNTASRKEITIDKIIGLICEISDKPFGKVIDLGCGPGLYTEKLAKKGYQLTGVDFSNNSIDYAKKHAKQNQLNIHYICGNYLDIDIEEEGTYDLVMMIYCDFGVLSMEEREKLMKNIYGWLKPGGIFILDALNEKSLSDLKFEKDWAFSDDQFWMETPYIRLSENRHYQKKKELLEQHVIMDEGGDYKLYRFWNHYFDEKDMEALFLPQGFKSVEGFADVIKDSGLYNNEGVTFYKIAK